MAYGITAYFAERSRFRRRLSLCIVATAGAMLAAWSLWLLPPIRHTVQTAVPEDVLLRWGFEGRDRFVRRILLTATGTGSSPRSPLVTYVPMATLKGGRSNRTSSTDPRATPEVRVPGVGPGESAQELLTRARAIHREAPVVQSEDVIVEFAALPAYPDEARERDLEGHVALIAHVDTTGRVVGVDVLRSSGYRMLDVAGSDAAWRYVFRPIRLHGRISDAYVVIRFAFSLR